MKIRKGFVTNSSSSSFILAFNKDEDIREELQSELRVCKDEIVDSICEDVEKCIVTKEECIKQVADSFWYRSLGIIEKLFKVQHNYVKSEFSIGDNSDDDVFWHIIFENNESGLSDEELLEKVDELAEDFAINALDYRIESDDYIYSIVTYGNECEGLLSEYIEDIIPHLWSCMYKISKH